MSTLSVVVTTYNRPKLLKLCLESLACQYDGNFDIHVVNDGGEDCEASVLSFYPRLHITYNYLGPQTTKYRLAAARNLGLKLCFSDRVLMLDGDFVCEEGFIEKHRAYGSRKVIVCSNYLHIPERHIPVYPSLYASVKEQASDPRFSYNIAENGDNFEVKFIDRYLPNLNRVQQAWTQAWGGCTSYPCSLVKEIGGFWEAFDFYGGEDGELASRLLKLGCEVLLRPDIVCYHLDHPLTEQKDWHRKFRELMLQAPEGVIRNGGPL